MFFGVSFALFVVALVSLCNLDTFKWLGTIFFLSIMLSLGSLISGIRTAWADSALLSDAEDAFNHHALSLGCATFIEDGLIIRGKKFPDTIKVDWDAYEQFISATGQQS
jgi:hypothetical protein